MLVLVLLLCWCWCCVGGAVLVMVLLSCWCCVGGAVQVLVVVLLHWCCVGGDAGCAATREGGGQGEVALHVCGLLQLMALVMVCRIWVCWIREARLAMLQADLHLR